MRVALLAGLVAAASAPAADWPQWLGPTRDGVWAETGVLDAFPAGGPKKLWSVPVGGGYSGPAVAGGKVFVTDYQRAGGDASNNPGKAASLTGQERVLCLDAGTGKVLWAHAYDCKYQISYPAGPRCTPTVAGGRVFALGAMGDLVVLDADTGKLLWKKDFKADSGAKTPIWGFSGHPLVTGDAVVCLTGGPDALLTAFDAATGAVKWTAVSTPSDGPGYAPPAIVKVNGADQLVHWNPKAVVGLDPATGKRLWSVDLKPAYSMSIMQPVVAGDLLFLGGIGNAAVALRLGGDKPAEVWRGGKSTGVYPVNMTPQAADGVVYAVDQPGQLRAVDLATGRRLWSTFAPVLGADHDDDFKGASSGTAFIVRNADRYFLFNEVGELVIARLTREKYQEVSKAKLVEPTGEAFGRKVVWSHPAFADRCVFVRNDKECACFSLAKE